MNLRTAAMDASSDQGTSICGHCARVIPSSNIDLHYAHCTRNLEKCKACGHMVHKKFAEKHLEKAHAHVSCSLCNQTMARESLGKHKGEICPQRIATCDFCEFPLPAIDLVEHQEVCGNRTELCHVCSRYVRLRERNEHETMCHSGEPSRPRDAEREHGTRRQPEEFPKKRLLFSMAITGVAVLLGSLFFQMKTDNRRSR